MTDLSDEERLAILDARARRIGVEIHAKTIDQAEAEVQNAEQMAGVVLFSERKARKIVDRLRKEQHSRIVEAAGKQRRADKLRARRRAAFS